MARLYFLLFLSPIHLCTQELEEYKSLIGKGVSLFPRSQNATPFHSGRKDPPVIFLLDTYVVWIWFVLKAAQRFKYVHNKYNSPLGQANSLVISQFYGVLSSPWRQRAAHASLSIRYFQLRNL